MPRFRVIAFVAAAALLTGAGVAEGVTRWSGTTLATVALGPAGDAWVGVVSNVAIPGRTPIVLDLVTDYTYSGDIDLELDADLVDEARAMSITTRARAPGVASVGGGWRPSSIARTARSTSSGNRSVDRPPGKASRGTTLPGPASKTPTQPSSSIASHAPITGMS